MEHRSVRIVEGREQFERNAIGVVLIRFPGTPDEMVAEWTGPNLTWRRVAEIRAEAPDQFGLKPIGEPNVLNLHIDDARAIYEALGEYLGYGGPQSQVRDLRKDYEAERRRVDRLLDESIEARRSMMTLLTVRGSA